MKLVVREAKKNKGETTPSLAPFKEFAQKFKEAHQAYNPKSMESQKALIKFAKDHLSKNDIVKAGLVRNDLNFALQNEAKKTGNYEVAMMAAFLVTNFDSWEKG